MPHLDYDTLESVPLDRSKYSQQSFSIHSQNKAKVESSFRRYWL